MTTRISGSEGVQQGISALADAIDHTKLTYADGETPEAATEKLCAEAREHRFCAVCVRPDMIKAAKAHLRGSEVRVATVIGFPSGKTALSDELQQPTIGSVSLALKKRETLQAVADGADELDLVMNVAQFKLETTASEPQPDCTLAEFRVIRALCAQQTLKIIIETDLLTPEEIRQATLLCAEAGADFVKTSTGMVAGGQGATVENIRLIRQTLDEAGYGLEASLRNPEARSSSSRNYVQIKASGGVNSAAQAQALVDAGATRLGASQGVAIVSGSSPLLNDY